MLDQNGLESHGRSLWMVMIIGAWIVNATPMEASSQKLTASDAAVEDDFGWTVALDGSTGVVGALQNDDACSPPDEGCNSGAAYVFEGGDTPGSWVEVAKLTASDAAASDTFGSTVSVSGDTVIVGAPNHDALAQNAGAAFVFQRDAGGPGAWGEVIVLTASDGSSFDRFASSVAISGDTAVVGAASQGSTDEGAAYVFGRDAGGPDNWGEVRRLSASDGTNNDSFGRVALDGDFLVVAALGDNALAGSAYVFSRNAGGPENWGEVRKLEASDSAAGDFFGGSLAISGEVIVIGASRNDDACDPPDVDCSSGSAYVFERHAGGIENWGEVAKLVADDAEAFDRFGDSVGISGDVVWVGATGDDDVGSAAGAVYVFERQLGRGWGQSDKITASEGDPLDFFGRSVALSGTRALVGATGDTDNGVGSGAAYLLDCTLFADGFETGNTAMWSSTAPPI